MKVEKKQKQTSPGKLKQFGLTLLGRLKDAGLADRASSLAFDMLMASIPLLLLFILLGSLFFADPTSSLAKILDLLPDTFRPIVESVLSVLQSNVNAGTIGLGVFAAIWLGSNGVSKLIQGVNQSFGLTLKGNIFLQRGFSVAYTVLFLVAIIGILFFFVFYQMVVQFADHLIQGFGIQQLDILVRLLNSTLSRLLPLAFFLFTLILFYRTAPLVAHGSITWKEASLGGVLAGLGILALTVIYGYVLDNVSKASLYYGSLAGILGLLVWLRYASMIVIFCGEIIGVFRKIFRGAGATGAADGARDGARDGADAVDSDAAPEAEAATDAANDAGSTSAGTEDTNGAGADGADDADINQKQ